MVLVRAQTLRGPNHAPWEEVFQVVCQARALLEWRGTYRVTSDAVEMVPKFSLDAGREYLVRINVVSLHPRRTDPHFESRVSLPATTATPTTRVRAIYPSSSLWPENILRFYLHSSSPMSGTSAIGHVRLLDDSGAEFEGCSRSMSISGTRNTRRTVFFDPGRVKRGIKPNVEMGRALIAGRKYAIVVSPSWRDAQGKPLAQEFRHAFTAAPAVEAPLIRRRGPSRRLSQGTRDPVVVRFPLGPR